MLVAKTYFLRFHNQILFVVRNILSYLPDHMIPNPPYQVKIIPKKSTTFSRSQGDSDLII